VSHDYTDRTTSYRVPQVGIHNNTYSLPVHYVHLAEIIVAVYNAHHCNTLSNNRLLTRKDCFHSGDLCFGKIGHDKLWFPVGCMLLESLQSCND